LTCYLIFIVHISTQLVGYKDLNFSTMVSLISAMNKVFQESSSKLIVFCRCMIWDLLIDLNRVIVGSSLNVAYAVDKVNALKLKQWRKLNRLQLRQLASWISVYSGLCTSSWSYFIPEGSQVHLTWAKCPLATRYNLRFAIKNTKNKIFLLRYNLRCTKLPNSA